MLLHFCMQYMLSTSNALARFFNTAQNQVSVDLQFQANPFFLDFSEDINNKTFLLLCTYLSEHNSSFRTTIIFAISLLFFPTLNGRHLSAEVFVHASFILYFNFDALNFTQVTNSVLLEHGRHTSSKIFKINKHLYSYTTSSSVFWTAYFALRNTTLNNDFLLKVSRTS